MVNLERVNGWSEAEAQSAFLGCCGAPGWADAMTARRPFRSETELFTTAVEVWRELPRAEWLAAFAAHPRIGDLEALRRRYGQSAGGPAAEQALVRTAPDEALQALADGNHRYEDRFGYIFTVCATGKTAGEMLALLRERLTNDPETELRIAAGEQEKITRLRLEKLTP
jgi:2-oxo-4-hydroxy-4-carboxy-5-ureidoimidazoline decarboxylase